MSVRALCRAVAPALAAFLLAGCVLAVAYYHDNKYLAPPPYGANGIIVVSDADLSRPLALVDGWMLSVDGHPEQETFIGRYSNFSYAPGGSSPFGSATYRLNIRYVGGEGPRALVLQIPEVFTDYRLYVDGRLAAQTGSGTEAGIVADGDTLLEFVVENRSHYYSGLVYPPVIGTAPVMAGLSFVQALCACLLVLAPLSAALFAFAVRVRRGRDAQLRDFSVLCAALAVAGAHGAAWMAGLAGPWVHAAEDAAWMLVFACTASLAARASQAMAYRAVRGFVRAAFALPLVTLVWVGAVIPALPASVDAYALFQTASRVACWALLTVSAVAGARAGVPEARAVLCACAVLGAALLANLLDNNAYEPLYGLWQAEYAGLALAGVFAWTLVLRVRGLRAAREQVRDLEVQVRAAETGLLHLRQGEEATRMARHDLRHHVAALRRLAHEDGAPLVSAYLDDLAERQDEVAPLRYSDNLVVNAVMAAYLSPAQAAGVQVSWDVDVPKDIALRSTEMTVLLSNLLSNAVEACDRARQEGRFPVFVDLTMRYVHGRLALRCSNAAPADALFSRTSKSDASCHGLGLPAMRSIVEEHGGQLVTDLSEGTATVRAVLRLEDAASKSVAAAPNAALDEEGVSYDNKTSWKNGGSRRRRENSDMR